MKVRRLTIDVLYDEAHTDAVEICLDKMATDWLCYGRDRGIIAEWEKTLSEPHEDFSVDDWDYFWEYDEATGNHVPANREQT